MTSFSSEEVQKTIKPYLIEMFNLDNVSDQLNTIMCQFTTSKEEPNEVKDDSNINKGRYQLCKFLSEKINFLDTHRLHHPPDEWKRLRSRSDIAYLDRGFFGLVFYTHLNIKHDTIHIAIKVFKLYNVSSLVDEATSQLSASNAGISPKIYDYYQCQCHGNSYGVIIMDLLTDYIPQHTFYQLLLKKIETPIVNDPIGRAGIRGMLKSLNKNLNHVIDILVIQLGINIGDFQVMIHNQTMQVKVIDFGMAEKVSEDNREEVAYALKNSFNYIFKDEKGKPIMHFVPEWNDNL